MVGPAAALHHHWTYNTHAIRRCRATGSDHPPLSQMFHSSRMKLLGWKTRQEFNDFEVSTFSNANLKLETQNLCLNAL